MDNENKRTIAKRDDSLQAPPWNKALMITYGIPREIGLSKAIQNSSAPKAMVLLDIATRRRAAARFSLQTVRVIILRGMI